MAKDNLLLELERAREFFPNDSIVKIVERACELAYPTRVDYKFTTLLGEVKESKWDITDRDIYQALKKQNDRIEKCRVNQ